MNDEPEEEAAVICMRVTPSSLHAFGSKQTRCDRCDHAVWLAPSSERFIAQRDKKPRVICNECLPAEHADYVKRTGDEDIKFGAVPGASKEFTNYVEGLINAENN